MEEKNQSNIFLSRGCCKSPKQTTSTTSVFNHGSARYDTFDWLKDLSPDYNALQVDCVEVRFKNNRKHFFKNTSNVEVKEGDIVAVEASPGHDIGIVTLVGNLVRKQMAKKKVNPNSPEIKKLYRKARLTDIEKWVESVEAEEKTMFKSRQIASDLKLNMKINDVEYQGDKTKAIFYYTADERVDFRELIKMFAEKFQVRIEMKQIGVRQEASLLGGIGSCGRELCCSTWMTNFNSVSTGAARNQQLSLNPQKLAGQCGKLKCCLNYENDVYVEALLEYPKTNIVLKTKQGDAVHQKTDVLQRIVWYSYKSDMINFIPLELDQLKKIIQMNNQGQIPAKLEDFAILTEEAPVTANQTNQDDLNRFDKKGKPQKK